MPGHTSILSLVRIIYIVGTRPNFVKMAPVIARLQERLPDAEHSLIHTGQHYDTAMSRIFFDELGNLPPPDHVLGIGSGTHGQQTARVIERLEPLIDAERPDLMVVPGDVNSTLAASLVAAKALVPLAHIESGLRSFDRTMPEEINRIVTDRLADYLFLHCDEAVENLRAEGTGDERMHFVGNTMIDTLVALEDRFRSLEAAKGRGLEPGSYLLVTLHRPSLVDGPLLDASIERLAEVADRMPVVFPAHPRTRKSLGSSPDWVIEPVGYLEFLSLEADAGAVLTDSGGIQEETTYLGVPCFTLRDNTERPVTIRAGTNTLLGLDPARIAEIPDRLEGRGEAPEPPPMWDGKAAERVAGVIAAAA
jgi:UDP-N-acetylglucosamine 2-epimerase (non-hydrolysing)